MMDIKRISVFGLGKLGATTAACLASKGYDVIGVDVNQEFVEKINQGHSPIYEPGVEQLINENKDRIKATTDSKEAIQKSDASIIIVPTPSIEDGSFSTKYVEVVAAEVGSILREKDDYHLVVVTSTVLPGDMAEVIHPLLEKTSGKKCGKDFGLCYNPDFIALGSIIHNLLNPDMILIGESDKKAGEILEEIHKSIIENKPRIFRMNFYNAELTKIALNSYCTRKITFANTLAEICENMPGGNVDVVTGALGADSRIGGKYMKGGLSYGGPCFPRDNRALVISVRKFGVDAKIAQMVDEVNDYHRDERVPKKILGLLEEKRGKKLAVLGLAYKKDTPVIEESAAISIIKALLDEDIRINLYDPAGMDEAKLELGEHTNLYYAKNIEECLKDASLCFIATPWDEFKKIKPETFKKNMKTPLILDAWGLYDLSTEEGVDYREIGKNK
ncbi:UDP-glucose dehydrogenase family protein [Candidatus Altiarchaeota archaeon]